MRVTRRHLDRLLLRPGTLIAWPSKFLALHTQPQSVRYRLGGMETRSRTRVRATSSPPREVTEGGKQPVSDVFVGQPSSAIGVSRDGGISPRSTSLGAGPRSACHSAVRGESTDKEPGPAQGAESEENGGFLDMACSDIVYTACISTTDARPIATPQTLQQDVV